jgi:hypothetical protein
MKTPTYVSLFILLLIFINTNHAGDSQGRIVIVPLPGFDDATITTPEGGNNALTLGGSVNKYLSGLLWFGQTF